MHNQCNATTKKGSPCKNGGTTEVNSLLYCGQHAAKIEVIVPVVEDFTDYTGELATAVVAPVIIPVLENGVKCGNVKLHGRENPVYHASIAEVKACYGAPAAPTTAPVVPTPVIPQTPVSATEAIVPVTETGIKCGNVKVHGREVVAYHASAAQVRACYGVKPVVSSSTARADAMEKAFFGSGRPVNR